MIPRLQDKGPLTAAVDWQVLIESGGTDGWPDLSECLQIWQMIIIQHQGVPCFQASPKSVVKDGRMLESVQGLSVKNDHQANSSHQQKQMILPLDADNSSRFKMFPYLCILMKIMAFPYRCYILIAMNKFESLSKPDVLTLSQDSIFYHSLRRLTNKTTKLCLPMQDICYTLKNHILVRFGDCSSIFNTKIWKLKQ